MGISGFTEWFLKTFPKTSKRVDGQPLGVDHVFIDFNQFVHKAARTSATYNILWKKLYKQLDIILNVAVPTQSVYIVMDGPASKAKLIEQRKRRRSKKSSLTKKKKFESVIDSRMITPGCRFTGQVQHALAFYACQRLQSYKYKYLKFFVSGANVSGEGELKIINYLQSMPEFAQKKDSFLLVGSDADLVLLGISSKVSNVSILNIANGSIKYHDAPKTKKQEFMIQIEIDKLIKTFSELIPDSNPNHIGTDFVALSILSGGNDYLPKLPHCFLSRYWLNYLETKKNPIWHNQYLIDPVTHKLNLSLFDKLLSLSTSKPLTAPPIHHERKLRKLQKLRADLQAGIIDKEKIIARYSQITTHTFEEDDNQTEGGFDEMTKAMEQEEQEEEEMIDEMSDEALLEGEEEEQQQQQNKSVHIPISQSIPIQSSSNSLVASSSSQQVPRDPIDIFLDIHSRDTWEEYDPDDHASQYIYGLEWVVNSYLRGESLSFDWFFPYSSSPGPKQLRDWIAKAKTTPSIVKQLPKSVSKPQIPPWMFAMMLIDNTTSHFVSASLKPVFEPGHLLNDIHDPREFYSFIDTDRVTQELAKLDISSMSKEDSEYSHYGPVQVYEKTFHGDPASFKPISPFGAQEVLRNAIKRTGVNDLKSYHLRQRKYIHTPLHQPSSKYSKVDELEAFSHSKNVSHAQSKDQQKSTRPSPSSSVNVNSHQVTTQPSKVAGNQHTRGYTQSRHATQDVQISAPLLPTTSNPFEPPTKKPFLPESFELLVQTQSKQIAPPKKIDVSSLFESVTHQQNQVSTPMMVPNPFQPAGFDPYFGSQLQMGMLPQMGMPPQMGVPPQMGMPSQMGMPPQMFPPFYPQPPPM